MKLSLGFSFFCLFSSLCLGPQAVLLFCYRFGTVLINAMVKLSHGAVLPKQRRWICSTIGYCLCSSVSHPCGTLSAELSSPERTPWLPSVAEQSKAPLVVSALFISSVSLRVLLDFLFSAVFYLEGSPPWASQLLSPLALALSVFLRTIPVWNTLPTSVAEAPHSGIIQTGTLQNCLSNLCFSLIKAG